MQNKEIIQTEKKALLNKVYAIKQSLEISVFCTYGCPIHFLRMEFWRVIKTFFIN